MTIVETETLHDHVSAALKTSGILQLSGINAGDMKITESLTTTEQKLQSLLSFLFIPSYSSEGTCMLRCYYSSFENVASNAERICKLLLVFIPT